VGEPVGDELDMWSEGGNLLLPNSKLTIHYANALHAYSTRPYPDREPLNDFNVDSVAPEITVDLSWSEYVAGKDPVLEIIGRSLRSRRKA
jgi:hypothetical protein